MLRSLLFAGAASGLVLNNLSNDNVVWYSADTTQPIDHNIDIDGLISVTANKSHFDNSYVFYSSVATEWGLAWKDAHNVQDPANTSFLLDFNDTKKCTADELSRFINNNANFSSIAVSVPISTNPQNILGASGDVPVFLKVNSTTINNGTGYFNKWDYASREKKMSNAKFYLDFNTTESGVGDQILSMVHSLQELYCSFGGVVVRGDVQVVQGMKKELKKGRNLACVYAFAVDNEKSQLSTRTVTLKEGNELLTRTVTVLPADPVTPTTLKTKTAEESTITTLSPSSTNLPVVTVTVSGKPHKTTLPTIKNPKTMSTITVTAANGKVEFTTVTVTPSETPDNPSSKAVVPTTDAGSSVPVAPSTTKPKPKTTMPDDTPVVSTPSSTNRLVTKSEPKVSSKTVKSTTTPASQSSSKSQGNDSTPDSGPVNNSETSKAQPANESAPSSAKPTTSAPSSTPTITDPSKKDPLNASILSSSKDVSSTSVAPLETTSSTLSQSEESTTTFDPKTIMIPTTTTKGKARVADEQTSTGSTGIALTTASISSPTGNCTQQFEGCTTEGKIQCVGVGYLQCKESVWAYQACDDKLVCNQQQVKLEKDACAAKDSEGKTLGDNEQCSPQEIAARAKKAKAVKS